MKSVRLDLNPVIGWDSFHTLFAGAFAFPDYYGRNLDAWIDCMEDFAVGSGDLRLDLRGMSDLRLRCPEIHGALHECAAFINYRSAEAGGGEMIAFCYSGD